MNELRKEALDIIDRSDLPESTRLFPGWWKLTDCKNNPRAIFVFGDNDVRKGCGGQAIIRYCPNAMGIPTKKYPSYAGGAYYTDREFEQNKKKILKSVEKLIVAFDSGDYDVIYFPEDGLGTGLSQLDTKAPKTLEFLNNLIYEVFKINYARNDSSISTHSTDSTDSTPPDSELSDSSE